MDKCSIPIPVHHDCFYVWQRFLTLAQALPPALKAQLAHNRKERGIGPFRQLTTGTDNCLGLLFDTQRQQQVVNKSIG